MNRFEIEYQKYTKIDIVDLLKIYFNSNYISGPIEKAIMEKVKILKNNQKK